MPRLSKIGAAALAAFGWTGLSSVTASYLVVAGGGGGGYDRGGGGGAGGLLTGTASLNPTLSYAVTVGAGGLGATAGATQGTQGSSSVFNSITTTGGGFGGNNSSGKINGGTGGSGGGGAGGSAGNGGGGTGGTGTSGQGFNGGDGGSGAYGGGGGGASEVGNTDGNSEGGDGAASSITGTSVTYAGGGGGGSVGGYSNTGGSGGGGAGTQSGSGSAGTANLGGGGGGGGDAGTPLGGNGGSGVVIISYPSPQKFGGGIVTVSGSNTIHTFTTSGTLSPLSSLTANFLVVAGGGGGGYNYHTVSTGGGGGAGGYRTSSGLTIDTNSTYLVTVGAGGAGAPNTSTNGGVGTDSFFSTITSAGGGYGATNQQVGGNGGSGGGASGPFTPGSFAGGTGNTPSTSPAQGFDGGLATQFGGGGGGGSSAAGQNSALGGAGGAGTANSISGASVTYATGGGANTTGTANTGDGGGRGTSGALNPGFAGGSGVVIISYASATQQMAGGTVTISGGNVIHTFTSSGYLTPLTLADNSLRFRASASAYLSRTMGTPTTQNTWTYSAWVKRGALSSFQNLLSDSNNSLNTQFLFDNTDPLTFFYNGTYIFTTSALYRDPAAWYHVVLSVNSSASGTNKVNLYVNGSQVTSFSTDNRSSFSTSLINASGSTNLIGAYGNPAANFLDGYLTEINFIDGQQLTPSSFGTFNSYGVWQPITYGGSYGTNGVYLPFTNTASTTTLGYDFSPQGNNWTPNNFSLTAGSTYDSMTDVPTLTSATAANYCVLTPLAPVTGSVLSNGNLTTTYASSSAGQNSYGSIEIPTTGQWYWEVISSSMPANQVIGIWSSANYNTNTDAGCLGYISNGQKSNAGTNTAYGASFTTGDVIGVAFDAGAGTLTFYKNNTSQGTAFSSITGAYFAGMRHTNTSGTSTVNFNFGQQPFAYTPPTNFVALNTFNL